MTPRESFIAALNHEEPSGRVPHFELEFFLTMEAFGRVHSSQRKFEQWAQMSERERALHRRDVADLHVAVARRYEQAGMLYHSPFSGGETDSQVGWQEQDTRLSLEHVRELSGMDYLITLHGDATYSLPSGTDMMDFVMELADEPGKMKSDA